MTVTADQVRDYSQQGEQEAILKWAATQPYAGSFLDLGAYDGESYSNTAALADLGWGGICVDAAPDAVAACATRYADRADVSVISAAFAVDGAAGTVTIHWSPSAMYSAISASKRVGLKLVPVEVPRLDLDWFADRVRALPRPLFCSADLEGESLDAVGWVLTHAEPDCVCVEANNPHDRRQALTLLAGWDQLHSNATNLVLGRPA